MPAFFFIWFTASLTPFLVDTGGLAPPAAKRVRQAAYRYHEGFSNAVRVTKRVADFL